MYTFSYANAKYINTDEDLIFVRKLQLSDELLRKVDQLDSGDYTWYVSGKDPGDDFHNGFIKLSTIYDEKTTQYVNELHQALFDLSYHEFLKIDPQGKLISKVRGFISWSHSRNKMMPATPHCDSTTVGDWTFLIQVKGTSGATVFLDNSRNRQVIKAVDFDPMTLVIFPSIYSHQGLLPIDSTDRYIVNFVSTIETSMNEKILSKSPDIIQRLAQTGE